MSEMMDTPADQTVHACTPRFDVRDAIADPRATVFEKKHRFDPKEFDPMANSHQWQSSNVSLSPDRPKAG